MGGVPFTMDVELGKIREFARATKSDNPDYLQVDHPVSPATFLMTSAFWSGADSVPWDDFDGDLDLDPSRLLHGGQEYVFHGEPPRAGSRLVGMSRIGQTYTKHGKRGGTMRFTEIIDDFRTTDGRLVAEVKSTLVTVGRPPSAADDDSQHQHDRAAGPATEGAGPA
nr:MaoC family dehydratase N-terminal domain-containing protein [Micromonospora sp. DSM 115978]